MSRRRETSGIHSRYEGIGRTDLTGANLESATLCRANLAHAIIRGANLRASKLQGANLSNASLYQANLKGADLCGSNLGKSDLRFACLEQTNLLRANLNRANLLGASLTGACLDQADLTGAILPDGTRFSDEVRLERFTDQANPDFSTTLAQVEEMDVEDHEAHLSWSQFVEQTYGSLSHDPIDWHPHKYSENEDSRE